ncbi:MAG: VWA domain-containing protein [Vicinamibacterales bacterium]
MRRGNLAVVLGLTAVLGVTMVAAGGAQDQPLFRASTRTVPVYATVVDQGGRLVPNLEADDFTIEDNGKPVEISLFSNESQPFTAVVMLDTSASMTANLERLNQAAEQFLLRLLPVDKAQVGAFKDKIQLSGTFTNDRDALIADLDDLQFGNPTRLNDAVATSLDALEGVEGRKVILLFSDGEDTSSRIGFKTVLERARDEEVMVYSIGLESEYFNGARMQRTRPTRDLRKIADETGGGYFELKESDALSSTFTRVAQELRSQYLLCFAPENLDGKVHKLEVKVNKPGMTARARRSYLAEQDKS